MGAASKQRKPNERLRYQRHLPGWTLQAELLNQCEGNDEFDGSPTGLVDDEFIFRWIFPPEKRL